MQVIINHKAFAFSAMTTELPPAITASLCRELLRTETEIHGISSIVPLSLLANEFSLPFLQLLLRVITSSEHPSEAHIGETVLEFLGACQFSIETGNSYFGELFNYLEWEEKTKVFKYLETFFLTHRESLTTFENEDISEVNGAVFVFSKTNQQGTELLPVFKDFFKKFSVVNAKSLDISVEKFQQFSELLVNILQLVSNESVIQMIPRKLHDIISIFLRLLIIHSSSLTDLIAKNDSVNFIFLKNMMGLLNSAYLANGQDKLKILLFDLLLQIKGSLTQALVATPNEDLIGTSPQASASGAYASDKAGRNEPSPGQLEPPGSANSVVTMSMILDLPEPGLSAYDFGVDDSSCLITLDNDEINHSSDIALANDDRLVLMSKEEGAGVGTYENPFKASDSKYTRPFRIESVGLIEDTSSGLNNGCISLSMFGAYTTKENPY
ncbi:hypothetical protein JCM33374_g4052 [Metschnikowia sp. JCM 33374]|nr:hypothetical protein JCM33374_g4052 [Metschnikowia sp. JCM 33374]